MQIDVVDISSWVMGGSAYARDRVVWRLDSCLRANDFVLVSGHGIPDSVLTGLDDAMHDFFGLPLQQKLRWLPPTGSTRGYAAPETEMMSRSIGLDSPTGRWDYFEAFDVGSTAADYPHARTPVGHFDRNVWPDVPDFQRRVDTYFEEAGRVARILMRALGGALQLGDDVFASLTDQSVDILRLNRYVYPAGETDGLIGMGAHEDFGFLGIVRADEVPGLEVVGHDGRWHAVTPPAGTLIVMVGETLSRFTAGRWAPTLHRVMPARDAVRHSAVYYHEGNPEAVVGAHPSFGSTAVEGLPVRIREHVAAKAGAVHPGGMTYWDAAALARLPAE
jgi:isopenicillin N synthase-like dioxygenase